jgi:hypothetical protein
MKFDENDIKRTLTDCHIIQRQFNHAIINEYNKELDRPDARIYTDLNYQLSVGIDVTPPGSGVMVSLEIPSSTKISRIWFPDEFSFSRENVQEKLQASLKYILMNKPKTLKICFASPSLLNKTILSAKATGKNIGSILSGELESYFSSLEYTFRGDCPNMGDGSYIKISTPNLSTTAFLGENIPSTTGNWRKKIHECVNHLRHESDNKLQQIFVKLEFSNSANFTDEPGPNTFDVKVGKTDRDLITFIVRQTKDSHSQLSVQSLRKARSAPLSHYSGKNVYDMVNFSAFSSLDPEYSQHKASPFTPYVYKPVLIRPAPDIPQVSPPIPSRFSNITYSKFNSASNKRRRLNTSIHSMQTRRKFSDTILTRSKSLSQELVSPGSSSSLPIGKKSRKKKRKRK